MTTILKTLLLTSVLALSACGTTSITGGSLTGHADAVIQSDKPTAELGIQLQLDFQTDMSQNDDLDAQGNVEAGVKPLLDLIGRTEGTDRGDGYNETLAYGAFTDGDVILTDMTLAEIDALQTAMLLHRDNNLNSSAVGRYQIVRTTLRALKRKLALDDTLKFTSELQDRLAVDLLLGRGLAAFREGRIDDLRFALNLSKEFASLPNPETGMGYYAGQKAAVDVATVIKVLGQMR